MTAPIPEPLPDLPRPVPPEAKRWGWWSWGWAVIFAAFALLEGTALWRNRHGNGLNDFQHRTLSENLWAVFAYHPDDYATAKHGKVRRLGFVTFMSWFNNHITSNGKAM